MAGYIADGKSRGPVKLFRTKKAAENYLRKLKLKPRVKKLR